MRNMPLPALGLGLCAVLAAAAPEPPSAPAPSPRATTLEQVRARIAASAVRRHPRLLLAASDFEQLKRAVKAGGDHGRLFGELRRQADALVRSAPLKREQTGRRMKADPRLPVLAMAYRMTGERAYLDRAREDMLAIAGFTDWNPSHFLDTAMTTFFLSVGYDGLYDELDEETRRQVRTAIVEKGLKPSLRPGQFWQQARHNWGQVCHGGLAAGALVVMEQEPELAATILHRAVTGVTYAMEEYAPDGSYPEGPGYWEFGTTYNVLLIAMLESALGTEFGLARLPGFDRTAEFQCHLTGPTGFTFNFADGRTSRHVLPVKFWFARRFHRPDWLVSDGPRLAEALRETPPDLSSPYLPFLLHWLPAESPRATPAAPAPAMARAWHGRGRVPVALFRSSWTDPDASYLALKAGSPSHNHGHMDSGAFVFEADGVRWAVDLGHEDYHRIESRRMDLWNRAQNSDRWRIFRLNNLSHNTLTLDGRLHTVEGFAPITFFSDRPAFAGAVLDLTSLFKGQAAQVHRGAALLDSGEALVQDHLQGVKPGTVVQWGMMTAARAEAPRGNRLVLRSGPKRLTLEILRPAGATWKVDDASTPVNEWDSANPGIRRVHVDLPVGADGALDLAVLLTPGSCALSRRDGLKLTPPSRWAGAQ